MDPKSREADDTLYWLEKLVTYSGLPGFMTETIDTHYVYNTALAYVERGEIEKFLWTFYSVFAYGQSRDTYSTLECSNIVNGSDNTAWNSKQSPHMHSNSRVIDMVRLTLLLEQGDTLHLMPATPRPWLGNGKVIEVIKAPTYWGDISYRAESKGKKVTITIDPPTRKEAYMIVHVRPPSTLGKIKSVTVDGKVWTDFEGEQVKLGTITRKTAVVCTF